MFGGFVCRRGILMSWRTFSVLGLVVCGLVWFGCSEDGGNDATMDDGSQENNDGSLRVAPNFTLLDTGFEEVSLADYRGKVVLVDFWATWCPPCREEMPLFVELYDQYRAEGFEILGISLDDQGLKVIEPFIEEIGVNYTILLGQPGLSDEYDVFTMPSAFLVNQEGRIVKRFDGAQGNKSVYEDELKKLL